MGMARRKIRRCRSSQLELHLIPSLTDAKAERSDHPRLMATAFCSLVLCSGLASPSCPAADQEPLTVMTWNLEWFYDDDGGDNYSELAKEKTAPSRQDWDWRRDAFAKRIAETRPTVLATQEVENRRVLWYLSRAIDRNHSIKYQEIGIEGRDHFTEQDVGMLIRAPAELLLTSQLSMTDRMREGGQYYDVSKHLLAVFEFPVGDGYERVTVMNVHLRSRAEGEPLRRRQALLTHHWIANAIKQGEHVILLGDFNTEETGDRTRADSDLGIISGLQTPDPDDDLIDLNLRLPAEQRQTHMLPGRQFDHIFCTPSLLHDDPTKPDLVFRSIETRRDLAVQGEPDDSQSHWDRYWELPADQRDLSDHYPVMATFEVR